MSVASFTFSHNMDLKKRGSAMPEYKRENDVLERCLVQQLRVLAALPRDMGSVPGTHMAVHNPSVTPFSGNLMLASYL